MKTCFTAPHLGNPGLSQNPTDITNTTFGQTGSPLNGARQMYLRTEIQF